jgi:hypothetical protein
MNVDVKIYINQFRGFFEQNPKDLFNLIGEGEPDKFFKMVEEQAQSNFEKGDEIQLTKTQLIDIVVILNGKVPKRKELEENFIFKSEFGVFFLN